jgi:hypothetical protein
MRAKAKLLIAALFFLLLASVGLRFERGSFGAVSITESEPCRIEERDSSYFLQVLATPAAVKDTNYSLLREYLSSSKTASQADVEGIMQTIDEIVSCQNEGNFAAVAALFSDQYWISEMTGVPAKADEFAAMADATPTPPTEPMEHEASFSDARALTDGRVAGFLRWDGRRLDDTQLVAFRWVDGVWLIDEVVFVGEQEVFATPQKSN